MELVLFTSLQASGKSTFYHTYFATTHTHISMDVLQHIKNPRKRQMVLIEGALQAQQLGCTHFGKMDAAQQINGDKGTGNVFARMFERLSCELPEVRPTLRNG